MFESVITDGKTEREVTAIFYYLLQKEIDKLDTCQSNEFLDNTLAFVNKMLKVVAKRREVKYYFSLILDPIVNKVETLEGCLELELNKVNDYVKKKDKTQRQLYYDTNETETSPTDRSFVNINYEDQKRNSQNYSTISYDLSSTTLTDVKLEDDNLENLTNDRIFKLKKEETNDDMSYFCLFLKRFATNQ